MSSKYIKNKLVTTVSQEKLPIINCRFMYGKYYKKGNIHIKNSGDVYYIPEVKKWYRAETERIIFDHRIGRYIIKKDNTFVKGVIGIEKDKLIFGHFSLSPLDKIAPLLVESSEGFFNVLNDNIFNNSRYYKYNLETEIYEHVKRTRAYKFISLPECNQEEKRGLLYDSKNYLNTAIEIYNKCNVDIEIDSFLKQFRYFFEENYSFGFEFETVRGKVPERDCKKLGLIPLRDGSIQGLEYATIPYSGVKGVFSLIKSLKKLKRYTKEDYECSLHLHVAGLKRTPKHLLGLYKVLYLIQDDFYSAFPLYKSKKYRVKRKDYTKELDRDTFYYSLLSKPEVGFDVLFSQLSGGIPFSHYKSNLDEVINHPSDPNGNAKWNIRSRYHWVNLIPIVFGNKKTVEFRIHTPTFDVNKVIFYLFTCIAIIKFVNNNVDKLLKNDLRLITKLNLNYIIISEIQDNKLAQVIKDYWRKRQQYFKNKVLEGEAPVLFNESNLLYSPPVSVDFRYILNNSKKEFKNAFYSLVNRSNLQAANIRFVNHNEEVPAVAEIIQQVEEEEVLRDLENNF